MSEVKVGEVALWLGLHGVIQSTTKKAPVLVNISVIIISASANLVLGENIGPGSVHLTVYAHSHVWTPLTLHVTLRENLCHSKNK